MSAFIENTFANRMMFSRKWLIGKINDIWEMVLERNELAESQGELNRKLLDSVDEANATISTLVAEINKLTEATDV